MSRESQHDMVSPATLLPSTRRRGVPDACLFGFGGCRLGRLARNEFAQSRRTAGRL